MKAKRLALLLAGLCASCGSNAGPSPATGQADGGAAADAAGSSGGGAPDAAGTGSPGPITETGILLDYETLAPVPGLTVTDNGASATTDANGAFSLTLPAGVTLLAASVTGPSYGRLLFPLSFPTSATVETGTNVIPSSATFALEQQLLRNDTSKGLVNIVAEARGGCTSAVGGAVQVLSPAGTTLAYFSAAGIPDTTATTFQSVTASRPVAVIYNVAPGSKLSLSVTHPTCKPATFPAPNTGGTLTGEVPIEATTPTDVSSAILLLLE